MPEVVLREYRHPTDYPAVFAFWQNAGEGVRLDHSDELDEIGKKANFAPDLFVLAELDGEIVGSVIGGYDGRRGLIYHLAVAAPLQGQGLGNRLMNEIEARLKARGCYKAYLLVMRDNLLAASFYEKRGWLEMKTVSLYGKKL